MSARGQDIFQDVSLRPETLKEKSDISPVSPHETPPSLNTPALFKYASRKLQCVFPSYCRDFPMKLWQGSSGRFLEDSRSPHDATLLHSCRATPVPGSFRRSCSHFIPAASGLHPLIKDFSRVTSLCWHSSCYCRATFLHQGELC